MNIDSIRHFIDLADAGSFYRAAERAYLSAQGFHKMLGSLEKELGVTLMNRSHTGLTLTSEGRAFLLFAHTVVDAQMAMLDSIYASDSVNDDGDLDLIPAFCTNLAMQALSLAAESTDALHSFGPVELPFNKIVQKVSDQGETPIAIAELCLSTLKSLRQERDLVIRPLYRTQIGVVTLKDSRLANRGHIMPEDILDVPIAVPQHPEFKFLLSGALGGLGLKEVLLEGSNEKIRVDFVRMSPDRAAVWDSFTFYLLMQTSFFPLDNLCFTPLRTPDASILICSLSNRRNPLPPRARHRMNSNVMRAREVYADYFERYPLDGDVS